MGTYIQVREEVKSPERRKKQRWDKRELIKKGDKKFVPMSHCLFKKIFSISSSIKLAAITPPAVFQITSFTL